MKNLLKLLSLSILILSGCAQSPLYYQYPKVEPKYISDFSEQFIGCDIEILHKSEPVYPYRALSIRQEGWVLVSGKIQSNGYLDDLIIVDSSPRGVFDYAVLTSISDWKISSKCDQESDINGLVIKQLFQFKIPPSENVMQGT